MEAIARFVDLLNANQGACLVFFGFVLLVANVLIWTRTAALSSLCVTHGRSYSGSDDRAIDQLIEEVENLATMEEITVDDVKEFQQRARWILAKYESLGSFRR